MWDYLIITAGNEAQAAAYRSLIAERRALGLIPDVNEVLVVPDTKGKRIGSGGSTILCLLEVLNRAHRGHVPWGHVPISREIGYMSPIPHRILYN